MVNHLTVVCGEGVRIYLEYLSKLVTHRSPLTKSSVGQAYKMCDFENVSVTTFRQLPIVWKKAKNFNVYDIKNNKFIDFTSTIFVANIGHSNTTLKKKNIQYN